MPSPESARAYIARTRKTIEEQRDLMRSPHPQTAADAADLLALLSSLVANVEHKRSGRVAQKGRRQWDF